MKTASILRFLASSLACLSLLHAEPETAPIPFSKIGVKATANYQGDAIGITPFDDQWARVIVKDTAGTDIPNRFGRVRVMAP
jgi:hypothetical protein